VGVKLLGAKAVKTLVNTYSPDVNAFFNARTTIHTGDSVKFVLNGFHTVDLPDKSGQALPLLTPGPTVTGVNDAAGNPFWFDGKLPSLGFNPKLLARTSGSVYNGTTRLDTGLPLGPAKPYTVKFTKPGTYKFFCDVHPGMVGTIVVKKKSASVPTAKQDATALQKTLVSDIKTMLKLARTRPAAGTVHLGEANRNGIELFAMFPATETISAGTTLTFAMSNGSREVHTATFGPASYIIPLSNAANPPKLLVDPAVTAIAVLPSSPPGAPIVESQTAHGNAFANTGTLDTDKATVTIPSSGKITFTAPGTYHYMCLIHPQMRGTVIVK
jgi:plastocyanin